MQLKLKKMWIGKFFLVSRNLIIFICQFLGRSSNVGWLATVRCFWMVWLGSKSLLVNCLGWLVGKFVFLAGQLFKQVISCTQYVRQCHCFCFITFGLLLIFVCIAFYVCCILFYFVHVFYFLACALLPCSFT